MTVTKKNRALPLFAGALLVSAAYGVKHFVPGLFGSSPSTASTAPSVPPKAPLPTSQRPAPTTGVATIDPPTSMRLGCARLPETRTDAWPCELSGGQRQRVAILQQVMCGHTYLLMDEPFSGLDPVAKHHACELIAELSHLDERTTIVIVTHDLREAVAVSDTLWLLGREPGAAGSRIVETYNLIDRELAWHPGIEQTPQFAAFVRELEDRFRTL